LANDKAGRIDASPYVVVRAGRGCCRPAIVRADDWPNRQIKIVIPYPPGGPTDISTRIVMEKAGQLLGQPILFDNKAAPRA